MPLRDEKVSVSVREKQKSLVRRKTMFLLSSWRVGRYQRSYHFAKSPLTKGDLVVGHREEVDEWKYLNARSFWTICDFKVETLETILAWNLYRNELEGVRILPRGRPSPGLPWQIRGSFQWLKMG